MIIVVINIIMTPPLQFPFLFIRLPHVVIAFLLLHNNQQQLSNNYMSKYILQCNNWNKATVLIFLIHVF